MSASASISAPPSGPASTATTSTAAPSVEPALPRVIGNYTLFDRIGRGGMADIFLARARTDLGATRLAVVKQILPHLAASREFSELLITEAKLAARLDHANVVQVHDLGRADGFLYIAMQYVEGFDLAELLRRCARTKTPLPIQYSLFIVSEVLKALDYAHRREGDDGRPLGIVHRDVSPSNVLVSFDGEVKICDFGIAHANDVVDIAPDDAIRGKAGYMSPEHANGLAVDARADVFALGIVLWELIAGRRLYRVLEGNRPLLEQARAAQIPDLPIRGLPDESRLHAIVRTALAADRAARYASARLMAEALDDYVSSARLVASPLRFGEWLIDHFGDDIIQQRRARERAIKALDAGPVAIVEPLSPGAQPAASLSNQVGAWPNIPASGEASPVALAAIAAAPSGVASAAGESDAIEARPAEAVSTSSPPASLTPEGIWAPSGESAPTSARPGTEEPWFAPSAVRKAGGLAPTPATLRRPLPAIGGAAFGQERPFGGVVRAEPYRGSRVGRVVVFVTIIALVLAAIIYSLLRTI